MTMRRAAIAITFVLAALTATCAASIAQPRPAPIEPGNITIIVPLAAGGPVDVLARLLADRIATGTGRTVIIENKSGAAGNVGAAAVARSEPNGRTWLLTVDSLFTVNPHMYASQGFDPDKDLHPISRIGEVVLMMAINPKVPAKTWAELLELSQTRPLNFGSAGIGSPGHLALEYLKLASQFKVAHVPFRGASLALTEVLAGNVDGAFIVAGVMLDYVRSGAVRALAVSAAQRLPAFPDVPTAIECGIDGFEARFSNIMALPANTPEPIRRFVAAELVAFAQDEAIRAKIAALGTELISTDEAETRAWIARERERWGKVVKAASLKGN